jgi:hypothetical protein
MVTPEIEAELAAGRPVGAELHAHRTGHRRLLFVYPVGASDRNSPPIMRFNVKRYEATIEIIEEGQNNSSTFFDLEWASADSLDTLEDAILKLAGGPVTLIDSYRVFYPSATRT